MNRFLILIFAQILSMLLQGQVQSRNIDGWYVEDSGESVFVRIASDTLEYIFLEQLAIDSNDYQNAEMAICNIKYCCGDLFEINCYENPDEYILNRIEVVYDTVPDYPIDSIRICFELDTALQRFPKPYIDIEVNYESTTIVKEAGLSTLFDFYSNPINKKNSNFSISFYPTQRDKGDELAVGYPGLIQLEPSLTPCKKIPVNGANMIKVTLNGLSADVFNELYIVGEYVYCNGEILRWRNKKFHKQIGNKYERLPRRGRTL